MGQGHSAADAAGEGRLEAGAAQARPLYALDTPLEIGPYFDEIGRYRGYVGLKNGKHLHRIRLESGAYRYRAKYDLRPVLAWLPLGGGLKRWGVVTTWADLPKGRRGQ